MLGTSLSHTSRQVFPNVAEACLLDTSESNVSMSGSTGWKRPATRNKAKYPQVCSARDKPTISRVWIESRLSREKEIWPPSPSPSSSLSSIIRYSNFEDMLYYLGMQSRSIPSRDVHKTSSRVLPVWHRIKRRIYLRKVYQWDLPVQRDRMSRLCLRAFIDTSSILPRSDRKSQVDNH